MAVIIEKRQVGANLSFGDEHSCHLMEGDFSQSHAQVVRDGIHVPVRFLFVYYKQQSRRDHIGLIVPSELTGRLAIWTEKEVGGSSSRRLECAPLEKEP